MGVQAVVAWGEVATVQENSVEDHSTDTNKLQHKVMPDDTLYSLARKHGLTVKELAAANGIEPPYKLRVGKLLSIPRPGAKPPPLKEKRSSKAEMAVKKMVSPEAKVAAKKNFETDVIVKIRDFSDWSLVCAERQDPETCSLVQNRVKQEGEKEKSVLVARVFLTDMNGKETPHLRLFTPLDVWLPGGFALKLDEHDEIHAPFLFCVPNGCMTDLGLGEELLPTVTQSKKLYVAYKRVDQTQTTVELTMTGFSDGLAALSAR